MVVVVNNNRTLVIDQFYLNLKELISIKFKSLSNEQLLILNKVLEHTNELMLFTSKDRDNFMMFLAKSLFLINISTIKDTSLRSKLNELFSQCILTLQEEPYND